MIDASLDRYREFLEAKVLRESERGRQVDPGDVNPICKPHQRAIIEWAVRGGRRAIFAKFGLGKCHGAGTPVLMADGSIRPVERVAVGERIMGDDGLPRRVLSLARGREQMYRITLKNGDSYTCNESHILALKVSNKWRGHAKGTVVHMSVREYLALHPVTRRNCLKHYKVPVDTFASQAVPMDSYLYGAWIGDGSARHLSWTINDQDVAIVARIHRFAETAGLYVRSEQGTGCHTYHVSGGVRFKAPDVPEYAFIQQHSPHGEKRIDPRYLVNDRETRLQLLAGIIDTDGYLIDNCFEVVTKWEGLRDDLLYLCRSLGLSVSSAPKIVDSITYWRVYISGDTNMVPCVTRKRASARRQIKNPLVYGFDVEAIGEGEYFGFAIDGNHRYLLGDFTVTHNTVMTLEAMRLTLATVPDSRGLIIAPLGVRQEFLRDANMLGTPLTFVRTTGEMSAPGLYLTNYESVREGKIDVTGLTAVALDEASILRGFGGTKTFRTFMATLAGDDRESGIRNDGIPFRFVATATPAPNDYLEIAAYAAFLGVMDVGEVKTRFFQRNSEKADQLTLYPHKEQEFWYWVNTWAVFLQSPADLGFPADGYELPPLTVNWHTVAADHSSAGTERDGQGKLLRDAAIGVQDSAAVKRSTLDARIAAVRALIDARPDDHVIVWHDLEDERRAIESAIPGVVSVYGAQDLDEREAHIRAFADGNVARIAAKPVMLGSGVNFQRHCHWAIFAGIDFKFNQFIQAVHRVWRYLQPGEVTIDIICSDAEIGVRRVLEAKWRNHDAMMARMSEIIRTYGLNSVDAREKLVRSIGVTREVATGDGWTAVRNDCVVETAQMSTSSVGLIVTSIPFGTQYEYSPSYNDFGHTDDDAHFWQQMDFLAPELLRVLQPGRVLAVHVKDRIRPGGLDGWSFQTVSPFHADAILHYRRHGFAYMGMITVTTDVVRENAQTYRLGWSEQCKDGAKMSVGLPEYVLLFRKPPTDASTGYADVRVTKNKAEYSRARWQFDAHGMWRSSGNRLLMPEDLVGVAAAEAFQRYREYSDSSVYDHEHTVAIAEARDRAGQLPPSFMLLQPTSYLEDVWTDVTRMRTLNGAQYAKGKEMHLCPLQFDIVDRLIGRFSNPGDVVLDPFGGLMTVPLRAVGMGRVGYGIELSEPYWRDGVWHLRAADEKRSTPTLFDLLGASETLASAGRVD